MKKSLWALVPIILFLALAALFWRGLNLDPHRIPSPLINKPAPTFYLASLDQPGQWYNNSIFQGQVSLLNVWASWCVTCQDEHAILMSIALDHTLPIYGLDYKDTRQDAEHFIDKLGNPFTKILFDEHGTTAINWGVYGTPETFILDKKGIIRFKQIGAITPEIWQHSMLPLIKKLQQESV
ncbi:MAG: DsbE family thiol:disulfide interchange protein [Legionellales bacterium]|nr:DsbE family thiol:disulfide interchange protein [Legionellales bacterium]